MKHKLSKAVPILTVLAALAALMVCSGRALEAAKYGLRLCAGVIAPSLLPFFVLSSMLALLGLPRYLGRLAAPVMSRLFSVSGAGATAFLLGITGGYPLGAAVTAELCRRQEISRGEGERLLAFCNNSGPAFIVGAAGVGVFGSSAAGLLLYGVHILAAALVGVLLSGGGQNTGRSAPPVSCSVSLAEALAQSVKEAVFSTLTVCGFVVFFCCVTGILDALGIFSALSGSLAAALHLPLGGTRSLLTGLLELGSGIGSMNGLPLTPGNLALAAFLLGWGGLSVFCQTLAVLSGSGLRARLYLPGRLLHGLLSAALALLAGSALL